MSIPKQNLKPNLSVSTAAKILLSRNLQLVHEQLELSVNHWRTDIEHIHQLRIATRRSIAGLDLFREFLPKKRRKRLANILNRIRRAAAQPRDLDVLIYKQETSEKKDKSLIRHLKSKRRKAQKPIIKIQEMVAQNDKYQDLCLRMINSPKFEKPDAKLAYSDWARKKLPEVVDRFFEYRPEDPDDLNQLHQFRIGAKKFRYALDLIKPAFNPGEFDRVLKEMKQLQDLLGKLNDRVVAVRRIRRMKSKGVKVQKHVLRDEIARLHSMKRKFVKWWTNKRANKMRRHFEMLSSG